MIGIHKILCLSLNAHHTHRFCSLAVRKSVVDDYEVTSFLGKGSTSRVYQGYHIMTGTQVIIKLFKNTIKQQKILRQIKANQLISKCGHVVPLYDVVRDPGCNGYGLIFVNLHGVPLTHIIGNIDFNTGIKYAKQILMALDYCHRQGVVHRDLKKSNVLINNTGAKLFDFGLAYIEGVHDFVTKRFGTKGYYTPEVMFRTPQFNRKIDIWVCGLIMAEILCNKKTLMPYSSDQETLRQIVQFSGYDSSIIPNQQLKYMHRMDFKKLLKNIKADEKSINAAAFAIEKMTQINPANRPEARQALQFDIFKNCD